MKNAFDVVSVNISQVKGERKKPVEGVTLCLRMAGDLPSSKLSSHRTCGFISLIESCLLG